MVSRFPCTSHLSNLPSIIPFVVDAYFCLVVVCKVIKCRPLKLTVYSILIYFLLLNLTPKTLG